MGQKVLHRNDGAFIGQALDAYGAFKTDENEQRRKFYQQTGMFPEDVSTEFADRFASEFATPASAQEVPAEDLAAKLATPEQVPSAVETAQQATNVQTGTEWMPTDNISPNVRSAEPVVAPEKPKVSPGYERFKQAEIQRRAEAEARLKELQAKALYYGGGTQQGNPQITTYTDPATGQQFYQVPTGRSGYIKTGVIPPAPVAINPATGEAMELPRGGKVVSPPGSADAVALKGKLSDFRTSIGELEALVNSTPSGRLAGNGAYYINKFTGLFPEVKTASSVGQLLVPMATRVLGGDVGNLSMTEQIAAKQLMQLQGATPEERRQAFAVLKALTERKQGIAERLIKGGMFKGTESLNESPEALRSIDMSYKNSGIALTQKADPDEVLWNTIKAQYPNESDDSIDRRFAVAKKGGAR